MSEEGFTDGGGYWLVALARAAVGDLPGLTIAYMVCGLAVMTWLVLRGLSRPHGSPQQALLHIGTLLMAALFILSPNYPWYVLAVVPFIVLGGSAPAWAMTLGAILLYKPAMLPDNDLTWKTLATLPFVVAVAVRLLSRFKVVKAVAKKSPLWLLATAVPALVASVSRGADELGMVASHLVHRARAAAVEPDLERVRRASVQIVSHLPVDPEVEPSHGRLAVGWLKRAARAALPFTAGVATADPEGLAAAASELDPTLLGPR